MILLAALLLLFGGRLDYWRADWLPSWPDGDRDCQSLRDEVLIARSRSEVSFTTPAACVVERGLWWDEYAGGWLVEAREVEISHRVELVEAHRLGGFRWGRKTRRAFAADPSNLAITTRVTSAAKGEREPGTAGMGGWLPSWDRCGYLRQRRATKHRWALPGDEQWFLDLFECGGVKTA